MRKRTAVSQGDLVLEPYPTARDKLVNGSPFPYTMVSNKLIMAEEIELGARWLYVLIQFYFETTSDGPDIPTDFPPMKMLCANLDASERTIQRWLKVLIDEGLIDCEQYSDTETSYHFANPEDALDGSE